MTVCQNQVTLRNASKRDIVLKVTNLLLEYQSVVSYMKTLKNIAVLRVLRCFFLVLFVCTSLCIKKRLFYRAASANVIFGKIGRIASQKAVLQLLLMKCMPILVYRSENVLQTRGAYRRLISQLTNFYKTFKTSEIKIVKACQIFFNFELPSAL